MSGIRTALITGHVCNNGKQVARERAKAVNIYKTPQISACQTNLSLNYFYKQTHKERQMRMMNLEGKKQNTTDSFYTTYILIVRIRYPTAKQTGKTTCLNSM